MKKLLLPFALLLILVSCNLDSSTGIFEQIYNETEKNNVTVSYMIGKDSTSYYFSTKENGLAKASSPFESYNKVGFVDNLAARFITSNGFVICSDRENGKYYALSLDGSGKEEITITAATLASIVEGSYFNGNPGNGKGMLTAILKTSDNGYYLYTGDQPLYDETQKTVDFSSVTKIGNIPDSSAPQIIGPGKYTFITYIEDVDQKKWTINDISGEFSSRPILCIDGLVILENGNTYVPNSYSEAVADIGDYSNFTGNRLVAAGVDQTGKIYGITDECSFSYNPNATENAFKSNSATTNSIHVGLIFDSDKIRAATTENGIKEFSTNNL